MIYIALYLVAVVIANLTTAAWGPSVSIINAFLLIGFDLTARDKLHDAWQWRGLFWKMALLIASGSALSWFLNRDAGPIALASFVAFACSGTVDAICYQIIRKFPRLLRTNLSNVSSAAVDSLIFPALAFGWPPLWWVVFGMFAAKILGGALWSLVLDGWPLVLVDKLTGQWIDWRVSEAVKGHPDLEEFKRFDLKRMEAGPDGWSIQAVAPGIVMLASEAAALMEKVSAKNYFQFDMTPRPDHSLRPVRVTVQWARGEAPAAKAARMEDQLRRTSQGVLDALGTGKCAANTCPGCQYEKAEAIAWADEGIRALDGRVPPRQDVAESSAHKTGRLEERFIEAADL